MKLITNNTDVKASLNLTPAEIRFMADFRMLDAEQKQIYMNVINDAADENRALRRNRPTLRLVAGM